MFLHGISHVLEDRDQDLLVTPVKLLLVVPAVREEEEGSGHPQTVRAGGEAKGGTSSRRGKDRGALSSKSSNLWGKDPPGIWIAPVWQGNNLAGSPQLCLGEGEEMRKSHLAATSSFRLGGTHVKGYTMAATEGSSREQT